MGHRLSKIVTRTGDTGSTSLGGGDRVDKDHPRVAAIGDIDELNSMLGLVLSHEMPKDIRHSLTEVQQTLFDIGGELSMPGTEMVTSAPIAGLEQQLEMYNATLTPLREFILPGGPEAAARCHLARAVCRRAERSVVALGRSEPVSANTRRYLNRLSDLLFVAGRALNRQAGRGDVLWQHARKPR